MNAALQSLLHLEDPPHRTALAFGAGIFIAFSPFLGLHTLIAIVIAFAFRLNRVAVVAGAWVNVWALIPCYMFGTLIGALLLGVDSSHLNVHLLGRAETLVRSTVAWSLVGEWRQALKAMGGVLKVFGGLLWPFIVGNTLLGLVASVPAYVLCLKFLEARAHRKAAIAPSPVTPMDGPPGV
ncbi:MAG: DUF2062 domain-containing protein [Vicinamibacteria bacterium]